MHKVLIATLTWAFNQRKGLPIVLIGELQAQISDDQSLTQLKAAEPVEGVKKNARECSQCEGYAPVPKTSLNECQIFTCAIPLSTSQARESQARETNDRTVGTERNIRYPVHLPQNISTA